jgi:pilus assembly protein CpaB
MRSRIFAVLAIAVLAGGGLAYGTYNFMQNQPVKTVNTPTQGVVVAAGDLQLGSEIKKEDVQVVQFPAGKTPEGTFVKVDEVVGRGVIVPIVKNEPILKAKLASKEAGSGLPPVIPEGMRAVSSRRRARPTSIRTRRRKSCCPTCRCSPRARASSRDRIRRSRCR